MAKRSGSFAVVCSAALVVAAAALSAAPAFAGAVPDRVVEGVPVLAPFAHVVFCKKNPDECRTADAAGEAVTHGGDWAQLQEVNARVNRAIRPRADLSGPLGDVWTLSPARGDCEDYALTKRHRLISLGWPSAALRLAVARTTAGEGHAVLLVRSERGDVVLDNRTDRIRPWRQAGLTYVKIQAAADARRWVGVANQSGASAWMQRDIPTGSAEIRKHR